MRDLIRIAEIPHGGFFQLLAAEQNGIVGHADFFRNLFGRFSAGRLIAGVDHGIEVIGPVGGRVPPVTVGDLLKPGRLFTRRVNPLLVHPPRWKSERTDRFPFQFLRICLLLCIL